MRLEVQGEIIVPDGDHEIDVAEHEVSLTGHIIRYDPEVSRNGCRVAQGKKAWLTFTTYWNGDQKGIDLSERIARKLTPNGTGVPGRARSAAEAQVRHDKRRAWSELGSTYQ